MWTAATEIHANSCFLEHVYTGTRTRTRVYMNAPLSGVSIQRNECNVSNARKKIRKKVRNKRSWRHGCSNNYPQLRPLLGRLLLQFNAAQRNEF